MTVSLKHSFTSPKSDGVDSTLVQPSNWNDEHVLTLAAGKVLGRDTSGSGAAQELPLGFDSTGQSMTPPKGSTAQRPASPVAGMMRYNTTTGRFEGYGAGWGTLGGGCTISDTAPSGPVAGDLWWKSDEGQMYVYYTDANSSQWVVANAFTGSAGYLPVTGGTVNGALNIIGATAITGAVTLTGNTTISSGYNLSGRINPRSNVSTTATTLSWNSNNADQYTITALASALVISVDSGSPVEGQRMMFRIKDNGTARSLTWTAGASANKGFRVVGTVLPTVTVANKNIYVGCMYNADGGVWDVVAVTIQA